MSQPRSVIARIPAGRVSKWVMLLLWIALAAGMAPFFGRLDEVRETGPTADLPRGAESAVVYAELEKFRSVVDQIPAVVIYTRDSGIADQDKTKIESDRAAFAKFVARGEKVSAAMPSDDGKALVVVVPLPRDEGVAWPVRDMRTESRAKVPPGLDIVFGGPGAMLNDYALVFENLDASLIVATSSIVIVLLLLIYRSPFLWLVPVLSAGSAAVLTQGVTYLLAKYAGLPVNTASASILMVLVFGVGTDYALLLIARYREELRVEPDRHDAMRIALRRSGPAIAGSAATVVVALVCLSLADMNSSRSLGLVGAVGVLCAFLAMATILPALLVILGRWAFWPFVPRAGAQARVRKERLWPGLAGLVSRHPRVTWLLSLAVIGGLALGLLGVNMGLGRSQAFQHKPEAVVAQEKLAKHFPAGASDPGILIAKAGAAEKVRAAAMKVPGIQVSQPIKSTDGTLVIMDVILKDPPESAAARTSVTAIREAVHAVRGGQAILGGATAERLDSDRASARDVELIIPIVLLVILLVLVLLLRALIAPLMLLLTVVVSYLAALGASNLLFTHVFGHAAVDWTLPLVSFVFLVALGVDYNIFLMTRVRQEVGLHGHAEGVKAGLVATGGVITSAGIVLAATFSTFVAMPVVDMVQFGVVVGLGVLIDTFLVRTLLVPALALDIGPRIWWPGKPRAHSELDTIARRRRVPA